MSARHAFVCIACGLRVSGRLDASGRITPYDRSGDDDAPPRPCLCAACAADRNRNLPPAAANVREPHE